MAEVVTECTCGQLEPTRVADLSRFQLMRDGGEEPDVICLGCGDRLCTAEDGDTLAVLVSVANDHECEAGNG